MPRRAARRRSRRSWSTTSGDGRPAWIGGRRRSSAGTASTGDVALVVGLRGGDRSRRRRRGGSKASSAAAKHASAARCSAGTASAVAGRGGPAVAHRGDRLGRRRRRPRDRRAARVVTATATGHHSSGSASIIRSSNQPRGRTGGNSVVRWYSKSSSVGHPSSWPVVDPARERDRPSCTRRCAWASTRIIITGASSAYVAYALARGAVARRGGRVRHGSIAAHTASRAERQPVARPARRTASSRTRPRARGRGRARSCQRASTASADRRRGRGSPVPPRCCASSCGRAATVCRSTPPSRDSGRVDHPRARAPWDRARCPRGRRRARRARREPPRCRRASRRTRRRCRGGGPLSSSCPPGSNVTRLPPGKRVGQDRSQLGSARRSAEREPLELDADARRRGTGREDVAGGRIPRRVVDGSASESRRRHRLRSSDTAMATHRDSATRGVLRPRCTGPLRPPCVSDRRRTRLAPRSRGDSPSLSLPG